MTDGPQTHIDRQERPAQPPRPSEYPFGPLRPNPQQDPQIQPLNEPGKLNPNRGPQPI